MQRPRGPRDVVRVHHEGVLAQLLVGPRLPRQHQCAALVGDDRDLLGDQVHAVPDRVHQCHVGQPVRGQGAGEVVLHVQHDRGPAGRAVPLVDLVRDLPHLRRVLAVHGEVLPGRVGERHVDDLLPPLRVVLQKLLVRQQPAHDVLGQLRPVHPDDRLPALSDLRPQRRHPLLHVRPVRPLAQEVRVRAQPVHPDPGAGRDAGSEHRVAAVRERVRPPPGEERRPVRAQDAAEQFGRDVVGQEPEVVRRRPRRVREVADAQVGPELAEHAGGEGQVVVLDQHGRALGRLLGQGLGERPVVGLVRRPLPPEPGVEDRLQRGLVQHVVDEPEHRVGDAVVRLGVHGRVDVEHPHPLPAGLLGRQQPAVRAPDGRPVAVAERGAHPHGARVRPDGGQSRDQPAATPPGVQRAVLAHLIGDRAAVRRDQHLSLFRSIERGSHTPQPSPAPNRSNVRPARRADRIRPVHATFRSAYSAISTMGGRSSVSTE